MASLSTPIYALNAKLYAQANGIASTTMSIPHGPCMVATQAQDPHQALEESIQAFLANAQDESIIDLQAHIAALMHGYSIQSDINHDLAYLNNLEPYVFSAIDTRNDVLIQSQMLHAPDKDRSLKGQEKERLGLEQNNIFEYTENAMYHATNDFTMQSGLIIESNSQMALFGSTKPA